MRLIAHNLDKTLLERTVALAEKTGGFGARQLRAVLDSTPLFGAGRVEDTLNLLGHALRKAVGLAAQELGTSAPAVVAAAGLTLVGHSSLKAALDLDWGEPRARAHALGLVLEEVARWQPWLEQQHTLAAQAPPIKEVMETIAQMITPDTEPDPAGEPGGGASSSTSPLTGASQSRIKTSATAAQAARKPSTASRSTLREIWRAKSRGRWSSVRPMSRSMKSWSCWLKSWRKPRLLQLNVDLGSMASPRMAQWAEQGVSILARPWPHIGPLFTKQDFTLDFARMQVTCPGGQRVPMVPGRHVQFPAAACDACALRAQCTKATHGQGRSLSIREDEQFQQKLRAKMQTQRGRASLRKRTAVEHTIAHQLAHQGRRARYKGLRKNQFDGLASCGGQ